MGYASQGNGMYSFHSPLCAVALEGELAVLILVSYILQAGG